MVCGLVFLERAAADSLASFEMGDVLPTPASESWLDEEELLEALEDHFCFKGSCSGDNLTLGRMEAGEEGISPFSRLPSAGQVVASTTGDCDVALVSSVLSDDNAGSALPSRLLEVGGLFRAAGTLISFGGD